MHVAYESIYSIYEAIYIKYIKHHTCIIWNNIP
jgi:hypothetical protein